MGVPHDPSNEAPKPRSTQDRVAQIVLPPSTRPKKAKPKSTAPVTPAPVASPPPLPPTPPPIPQPEPAVKRPKYNPIPESPVGKSSGGNWITVVAVAILILIIALVLFFELPQEQPSKPAPVVTRNEELAAEPVSVEQSPTPRNSESRSATRAVNSPSPNLAADETLPGPTPEPVIEMIPAPQVDSTGLNQGTYRVTTDIPDGFLNMRSGPGVGNPIIQKLQGGLDGVTLVGEPQVNGETTWQQISSRGITGWVNADFLTKDEPEQQVPFPTPAPAVGPTPMAYTPPPTFSTPAPTPRKNRTYRWRGQTYKVTDSTYQDLILFQDKLKSATEEYKQSVEVYNEAVKKYQRSGPAGKWKTNMLAAAKKTLLDEAERKMRGVEAAIDHTLATTQ